MSNNHSGVSLSALDDAPVSELDHEVDNTRAEPLSEHASARAPRRFSIGLRALVVSVVVALLCVALSAVTWLYLDARVSLEAQQRSAGNERRAEQIALDYAVGAATMNYQDLNAWKARLVAGTTDNLKDKLTKAATSMEQILVPLEWNSTAKPLAAKVRSDSEGVFVVDTFVSVMTKTTQAPDTLPSTATYSISIDSHNNWSISDVGGIGAVMGSK